MRVILGHGAVGAGVEALPYVLGLIEVKAGQHKAALRQGGDGFHEQTRRPARGRGAGHKHRITGRGGLPPLLDSHHGGPQPRLGTGQLIGPVSVIRHGLQQQTRPLPMLGMGAHIEAVQRRRIHAFTGHLIHQCGQGFGQIGQGSAGGKIRGALQ